MPTRFHWFDFETEVTVNETSVPVTVEATVSSYGSNKEIEGVKVKLKEQPTELVLSDKQMREIYAEVWEHFDD